MMKNKCLSEEDLIDYLEGRLSEKQRLKIEHHLAACERCLEEATLVTEMTRSTYNEAVAEDNVPGRMTRKTIAAVNDLKNDSLVDKVVGAIRPALTRCAEELADIFTFQTPVAATVRGNKKAVSDDLVQIKKSFHNLDTDIEIEKTGPTRALIRVILTKNDIPEKPVRITLFQDMREVSSFLMDEDSILFEDIAFGHYVLVFSRNGNKAGEYAFEIRDE